MSAAEVAGVVAGVVVFVAFIVALLPSWIDDYQLRKRPPLPFKADVSGKPLRSQVISQRMDPAYEPPSASLRPPPTDTSWLGIDADEPIAMHCGEATAALEAQIPSYTDELIARIDHEIAAEQHRQGMRYGRKGHCEDCDTTLWERRLRNCCHRDVVEVRTLDNPIPQRICATCGKPLEVMADDGT